MIRFNSDYTEGCHPAILRRLEETNMEQTAGYGEDEYCREAAERIKAVCEAPDANVHFLVGGTQTNVTVIASALRPYQGAITATTGHINVHETGAVEACGYKCLTVDTPDGKLTAEQVEKYTKAHFADESFEHMVQPKMVYRVIFCFVLNFSGSFIRTSFAASDTFQPRQSRNTAAYMIIPNKT